MENASKALIIAGAILLAILLISLGIFVFSGAQDASKNSGLDSQQASAFNSAIVKYEGQNKSSSDVRNVKNEIIAANRKLTNEGRTTELIKINGGAAANFKTGGLDDSKKTYKIELSYSDSTGYVTAVTITGPNI